MIGDFLDRLNRAAYREWLDKWQRATHVDSAQVYGATHAVQRMFLDSLPARHRVDISSPAYLRNWRPV